MVCEILIILRAILPDRVSIDDLLAKRIDNGKSVTVKGIACEISDLITFECK